VQTGADVNKKRYKARSTSALLQPHASAYFGGVGYGGSGYQGAQWSSQRGQFYRPTFVRSVKKIARRNPCRSPRTITSSSRDPGHVILRSDLKDNSLERDQKFDVGAIRSRLLPPMCLVLQKAAASRTFGARRGLKTDPQNADTKWIPKSVRQI
jgi:hypothetical protein